MLNLDTHIVVDLPSGHLSKSELKKIRSYKEHSISTIVLWELEKLNQKKRIDLDAATSVVKKIPLLTRDRKIKKSKMIKFA